MSPVRRRSIAAALAAATILVGVGCGGGSSSSNNNNGTTTAAALSADQFRQQADAICKEFEGRLDAIAEPTDEASIAPFLDQGIALSSEQLTRLKTLTPPAELKGPWDQALGLIQRQLDIFNQAKTRIGGGESATTVVTELSSQVEPIEQQLNQKAAELGLKECGDNDGGSTTGTTTGTPPAPPTDTTTTTTPPPTDTTAQTPGGTVSVSVFVADIEKFARSLTQFGLTLQAAADGPEALQARSGLLRSQLDDFDQVVGKMGSYTVDTPELERKRAAIVAASPDISRLGRELLDAAEQQDAGRVASIAAEFQTALQRLQTAAQA